MINGVLEIVAAVLFVVVYLSGEMNRIWLWVAGAYLVFGVVNLVFHTLKNRHKLKKAEKTAKKAEEAAKIPVMTGEVVEAPEKDPVQELAEV